MRFPWSAWPHWHLRPRYALEISRPTVYIPTLEGGDRLASCLESLGEQTVPVDVVVADNGSGDGCRELLENRFPDVERIAFGRNLGFGTALNRAIAATGDGPVILLNDDAVADPEFVQKLVESSAGAEMVAAVLVSERDPGRIDSAGVLVDQTLMAFDHLTGEPVEVAGGSLNPTGPTGGGALYSRDAFNGVGGFDENIFLYYEDVDLALRIHAAGGRCVLARDARAVHGYSETLGARSARKYTRTGWSRGYLLRLYRVLSGPAAAFSVLTRELAICAGQLIRDRTIEGLKGRLRGWKDAAGLPARHLPEDAITRMSARQALELRRRRHAS